MNTWLLLLALAQGADAATTGLNLRRGCVEANPLLPHYGVTVAAKTGLVVGLTFAWGGKPLTTGRKATLATLTAVGAAAAVWNATRDCQGAR